MRREFGLVFIVLVVVSSYALLQCVILVLHNNSDRISVLSTDLLDVKPVDVNMTVPVGKPFNISLTFENPTIKTVNLTDASAEYYTLGLFGDEMLATSGLVRKSAPLGPGRTQIILTEKPTLNNGVSSSGSYYWFVHYSLRLGSVNYRFVVEIADSSITPQGIYSLGENQVYSQIRTYTLLTADAWAFALMTMALLELARERRVSLRWNVPQKEEEHSKMLAVNYAIQGMGIIVALFFPSWINFMLSEPPSGPSLQGSADAILWGFSFIFAILLFALAMSFLTRPLDAKPYGLFVSFIGSTMWFVGGVSVLAHLASIQDVALASLLLAASMGNVIAVFILLRMKQT